MILWTGNDNPAYIRVVHEIETTKFDIIKMENELRRLNEARANHQSTAELYDANIEFIQKYAKVINLREYLVLKNQLQHEVANLIYVKNQIPMLERQIDAFKFGLANLESSLHLYESKVLEFKRRD